MILRDILHLTLVFFIIAVSSSAARAQCTNPAGVAGEEFYNFADKVFQYCNGDDWVAMVCNNEADIEPLDCSLPWGGSILHSASITAYQNATEAFGGSCITESRTCNNGALSGSYVNQNCSVTSPADCTQPWGGTVLHGNDITAYLNANEPFGGSCTSETRTCSNGALSGTYTSQNCSVTPPADCALPWGGTVSHGNDITAYLNANEPFGGSCTFQTRSCNNGTLSGAYSNESCSVSTDPCDGSPSPGDTCADGTVYAGLSPDGNVPMYTTPADSGFLRWNNGNSTMTSTSANSLTNGLLNTIILENLSDSNSPYEAAQACIDLSDFGNEDWYLPAREELHVLYQNKDAIGGFDLSGNSFNGFYWSSSEQIANTLYAWSMRLSDGALHHSSGKNNQRKVRCVRKDGATPDLFDFIDQNDVEFSTQIVSNTINISGISSLTSVSVSGDDNPEVSINNGPWVSNGTIANNQTLRVRLTSSANFLATQTVTVNVGGVTDQWQVTTRQGLYGPVLSASGSICVKVNGMPTDNDFPEQTFFATLDQVPRPVGGPCIGRHYISNVLPVWDSSCASSTIPFGQVPYLGTIVQQQLCQ